MIDCLFSGTSRIRLPFDEDHGFTDLTSDYAREFREEILRIIKPIGESLEQLFVLVSTWSWSSRQFVHAAWFLLQLPSVRIPQRCNVELWFGIPSSTFLSVLPSRSSIFHRGSFLISSRIAMIHVTAIVPPYSDFPSTSVYVCLTCSILSHLLYLLS